MSARVITIRTKFTVISALAVCAIVFAAVATQASFRRMADLAGQAQAAGEMIRNHMDGDMMHDALRADVLKAALGRETRDAGLIEEAAAEARAHGERLLENLGKNREAEASSALAALFAREEPALKAYVGEALGYMSAAAEDIAQGTRRAVPAYAAFAEAFERIEDSQEETGNAIEDFAAQVRARQESQSAAALRISLLTAVLTVFLTLCIPVLSRLWLFTPQRKLIDAMESLARDNIDTEVPYVSRGDEVGQIAKALLVFRENAEKKAYLEKEQESQKRRAEETRRKEMTGLADSFESGVKSVVDAVASAATEMDATASGVMKQVEGNGRRLGELTQGIELASQNVETVASAATELSSSISEIGAQVARSGSITSAAVQEARRANKTAETLSDTAQKIGSILGVINEIAGQINLLALNATIEAARAGDAGKGFAVVASEVKNLANETTKATQEIEGQIAMIQSAATDTVGVIQQISGTIDEINAISASIAAAVEEQGMATQEIARNVQQAADITQTISEGATEVRESSVGMGGAVTQMIGASSELSRQAEALRGQVGGFLRSIRAG